MERNLIGGTGRASYAAEANISPATATGDLRRLMDCGLITQSDRARSVRYGASAALRTAVGRAERS